MLFLILKYLHLVGAAVLLGTGSGIAFFMLRAHMTGDAIVLQPSRASLYWRIPVHSNGRGCSVGDGDGAGTRGSIPADRELDCASPLPSTS
jgi:hypothetical protein